MRPAFNRVALFLEGWRGRPVRFANPRRLDGPMPVEKVSHLCLTVEDMDAAIAFYRDRLGLELKFREGRRRAEFDAGKGTSIALSSAGENGPGALGPVAASRTDGADARRMPIDESLVWPLG